MAVSECFRISTNLHESHLIPGCASCWFVHDTSKCKNRPSKCMSSNPFESRIVSEADLVVAVKRKNRRTKKQIEEGMCIVANRCESC